MDFNYLNPLAVKQLTRASFNCRGGIVICFIPGTGLMNFQKYVFEERLSFKKKHVGCGIGRKTGRGVIYKAQYTNL